MYKYRFTILQQKLHTVSQQQIMYFQHLKVHIEQEVKKGNVIALDSYFVCMNILHYVLILFKIQHQSVTPSAPAIPSATEIGFKPGSFSKLNAVMP